MIANDISDTAVSCVYEMIG